MLVEFRVKNFKPFQDECVLSMVASSDKSLAENTIPTKLFGQNKLLRSVVVYGANASGKSSLIEAMGFMRDLVIDSNKHNSDDEIPRQPFLLDSKSHQLPSEFEVTFMHHGIRYQYGFSVDQQRVHEEWLLAYPKGRAQTWCQRTLNTDNDTYDWYFGPNFRGEKKPLKEQTKSNILFLSKGDNLNNQQLTSVYKWFAHEFKFVESRRHGELRHYTATRSKEDPSFYARLQRLLQIADLGITDVSVQEKNLVVEDLPAHLQFLSSALEGGSQVEIKMLHETKEGDKVPLSLNVESLGTQQFFAMGGPLIDTLLNGYILCVDELDDSLHPNLVRALVSMFHNPELNPHHAQLIFNTHDTTLLDSSLFRRDQIWLIEKNSAGASHLYSLLDYSPRKDEALAKGYLLGRYGAIPFIREDLLLEEGFISDGKT